MRKWLERFVDVLYPGECLMCGGRTALRRGLDACEGCLADLPRLRNACESCADTLAVKPGSAVLCGACLSRPPPYSRTFALGEYSGGLAHLIRGLKFERRLENGRLLGLLLGRYLSARPSQPLLHLVPVPLHHWRLCRRGFNQATEIAKWAARESGLGILDAAVRRRRKTAAQSGLSAAARRANLRGAFECHEDLSGLHLAIVDDVMTTGATAASLAGSLRTAGCSRVEVWCCARARL